ncbi:hypothetical protein AVEN_220607-1 [Araneus ventricosus]|uniref:Uncharacterized protein n=1 Tax=Araneus ventricosus TaxID=182803 RepID=A0A4Y2GMM3_ARAVE|nr:hypothetical protein AVEN_220607-1 [Araneus ventricosus]
MFTSQYPPPDIGNSLCLVVRISGSEPKGPQFYPRTATISLNVSIKKSPDFSVLTLLGSTSIHLNPFRLAKGDKCKYVEEERKRKEDVGGNG